MAIKKEKPSGTAQVVSFLQQTPHPLKDVMELLRTIILQADVRITEHIKWNAPSFIYQQEDRLTMNASKPDKVLLVFHNGATGSVTIDKKKITDTEGMLKWQSDDRAVLEFHSVAELQKQEEALVEIIRQWLKAGKEQAS